MELQNLNQQNSNKFEKNKAKIDPLEFLLLCETYYSIFSHTSLTVIVSFYFLEQPMKEIR